MHELALPIGAKDRTRRRLSSDLLDEPLLVRFSQPRAKTTREHAPIQKEFTHKSGLDRLF
jgi:hypothetical protein